MREGKGLTPATESDAEIQTPEQALTLIESLLGNWKDMPNIHLTQAEQMADPHGELNHNQRRSNWFNMAIDALEVIGPFVSPSKRTEFKYAADTLHEDAIEHRAKLNGLTNEDVQLAQTLLHRAVDALKEKVA